jgi:acyl-CoA-binding protein
MNRQQLLDLYFLDARAKLIDIAAFLDRLDRAPGAADFRADAFAQALEQLRGKSGGRAEQVLLTLSDRTREPIAAATTKAACGACPGQL